MRGLRAVGFLLAGALAVVAVWAVGLDDFQVLRLDLGTLRLPNPNTLGFYAFYLFLGTLAAGLLAAALQTGLDPADPGRRLHGLLARIPDRAWILGGALAALLIAVLLRLLLLDRAPLTDDESAYRFTAELLASGRLYVDSPEPRLFFDRVFMINDGKLYSQYFLGWPALMVPGVWLGLPDLMNAVYSALTVPPLFWILRRLAGRPWAVLGLGLYLLSPLLMLGAATEMAHTSCLAILCWLLWLVLEVRARPTLAGHAGVALLFAVAFFNRPVTALGIGGPWLVVWLLGLKSLDGRERLRALAAFALPATVLAGLFLAVNWAQNGSPWSVGYQRVLEYARENNYHFAAGIHRKYSVHMFEFDRSFGAVLAHNGVALFRLNLALFGWPCSLLLAACAGWRRSAGLCWWAVLAFLLLHSLAGNPGVDSFGPVHYFELALPILVLTVLGVQRLTELLAGTRLAAAPLALVGGLVLVALAVYVPVRFHTLAMMVHDINAPQRAVVRARLDRAVVFSPLRWAPFCYSEPAKHFVRYRPNNDPDLDTPILWVNHLTLAEDRALMRQFPDREGYLLIHHPNCQSEVRPLRELKRSEVEDGVPLEGRWPDRSTEPEPAPRANPPQ